MKANAEGIKTLVQRSELIVAAPLGDLTDEEFRKTLIQESVKLAGSEGLCESVWICLGFLGTLG